MVQNGQHLAPAGPDEFLNEWIQELGHTPNHPSLHWFPTEIIKHKQYIYIQYSGMIWGPQCEESLMISHNISLDPFGSYV